MQMRRTKPMDHDKAHQAIAYWKAQLDRATAQANNGDASYSARAASRAAISTWLDPEYFNHLENHLAADHRNVPDEPWPLADELESHHNGLHCPHCGGVLIDEEGASWPYCPDCEWCPDCPHDEEGA